MSTGPIAVGYSRRTSRQPAPRVSIWSASRACRCASTPSLTRPGSTPSSWLRVVQDLLDGDDQPLAGLVGDRPDARPRRRCRPAACTAGSSSSAACRRRSSAWIEHRPVGLDQDQPRGAREVGGEPADVVDRAPRDDQPHGRHTLADVRGVSGGEHVLQVQQPDQPQHARRQCRSSTVPPRRASMARASSSGEMPDASANPTPLMSTTSWVQSGSGAGRRGPGRRRPGAAAMLVMSRSPSSRTTTVRAVRPDVDRQGRLRVAQAGLAPSVRPPRRGRPRGRELAPRPPCLPDRTPSTPAPRRTWEDRRHGAGLHDRGRGGPGHDGRRHRRGVRPRGPAGRRRRAHRGGARARPRAPAQLHRPGGHAGASSPRPTATPWSAGCGSAPRWRTSPTSTW